MITNAEEKNLKGPNPRSTWRPWAHFGVAAAILLGTVISWNWAVAKMEWVMEKEPVPWPPGVNVVSGCRMDSLPTKIGPYVLVGDGELNPNIDGVPDGETIISDDVLEFLKINTPLDKMRLGERRSNWYFSRLYRDSREKASGSPYKYWRLEVSYYTGGLDKVPHIPERCLVAGGATLVSSLSGTVSFTTTSCPSPWDKAVTFNRTGFEYAEDRLGLNVKQYTQYYTFSLNGKPENSREKVRLYLNYPWVRYCYFAKIQFGPAGEISDITETDRQAQDFVSAVLPAVISTLPMPSDIEQLEQKDKNKQ